MDHISFQQYESPAGTMIIGDYCGQICMADWAESKRHLRNKDKLSRTLNARFINRNTAITERTVTQLNEYFNGQRREFDLPLLPVGTEFRKDVWHALAGIGYGRTTTYAETAMRINAPQSVRAVASAIGDNMISIIIPCHRVIGRSGALTGYAGGLNAKSALLALEAYTADL